MPKTRYKIGKGFVIGQLWSGGSGGYASKAFPDKEFNSVAGATAFIKDKGAAMDSGMGFQCVRGGIFPIERIETITRDGKQYVNTDRECFYIDLDGVLTKSDKDTLCAWYEASSY